MRLLAWFALSALLLLPSLAHAAPRATLDIAVPPLAPSVATTIAGNVTYSNDQPTANTSLVDLAVVAQPSWAEASLAPSEVTLVPDGSGSAAAPVRLTMRVAPGTPAATQGVLRVALNATTFNVTSEVVLRVAYQGGVNVTALQPTVRARPGDPAQVPLRLRNDGNGAARIRIEVTGITKEVHVPAPPEYVVDPGATRDVNVSVLADAGGNFPVQLHWRAGFAFDERAPAQDGDVAVALDVRSAGTPLPALLALSALALAAARRR